MFEHGNGEEGEMPKAGKRRITVEAGLGLVSLCVSVLTLINAEWIEALTSLDPDAGSGALEWAIAIGFGLAGLALAARTVLNVRRLRTARA
jgi:hypothetical protein